MFLVIALLVAASITAAAIVIDRRPKGQPTQPSDTSSVELADVRSFSHAVQTHVRGNAI